MHAKPAGTRTHTQATPVDQCKGQQQWQECQAMHAKPAGTRTHAQATPVASAVVSQCMLPKQQPPKVRRVGAEPYAWTSRTVAPPCCSQSAPAWCPSRSCSMQA